MKEAVIYKFIFSSLFIVNSVLVSAGENFHIKRQPTQVDFNALIDNASQEASSLKENFDTDLGEKTDFVQSRNEKLAFSRSKRKSNKDPIQIDMGLGDASLVSAHKTRPTEEEVTPVNMKEDIVFEENMEIFENDGISKRRPSNSMARGDMNQQTSPKTKRKTVPN